jgi:hypothetical protein
MEQEQSVRARLVSEQARDVSALGCIEHPSLPNRLPPLDPQKRRIPVYRVLNLHALLELCGLVRTSRGMLCNHWASPRGSDELAPPASS